MQPKQSPTELLAERFALRLRMALDEAGYPARHLDRAKMLANNLGIDVSIAHAMMSGYHLPDYVELMEVCGLFNKEPGYFLDGRQPDMPVGTVMAEALGPGPGIGIQWPELSSKLVSDRKVFVYRAKTPMGFGTRSGDLLITASAKMHAQALAPSKLYLVGTDEGFELRLCIKLDRQSAVFVCDGGVTSTIIMPADDSSYRHSGIDQIFHHFGEVMFIMREAKSLVEGGVDFPIG